MLTLDQLFPPGALESAIADGHVREQTHPTAPLTIYNYTEVCAFAGAWTDVTLTCRGLIADATRRVIARPYAKFFNHDQPGAPALALHEPVTVTDKADGSLGIVYAAPDGWAVATRGSFASDQAGHATARLRERYAGWAPPQGFTVLVEIIYPDNRIVLNYAGLDDLVLLGAVEIATGRSFGPEAVPDWCSPTRGRSPSGWTRNMRTSWRACPRAGLARTSPSGPCAVSCAATCSPGSTTSPSGRRSGSRSSLPHRYGSIRS